MWDIICNQFSANQSGVSQSWAFWAVVIGCYVVYSKLKPKVIIEKQK